MPPVVYAILSALGALFRSQRSLRVENIALRHQLAIYQRTVKRPRIRPEDRILWSWLSRHWASVAGGFGFRPARDRNRMATQTFSRSLGAAE